MALSFFHLSCVAWCYKLCQCNCFLSTCCLMIGAASVALMLCVGSSRFDKWLRILCVPGKVVLDAPIVLFRWAVITCMFWFFFGFFCLCAWWLTAPDGIHLGGVCGVAQHWSIPPCTKEQVCVCVCDCWSLWCSCIYSYGSRRSGDCDTAVQVMSLQVAKPNSEEMLRLRKASIEMRCLYSKEKEHNN